MYWGGGLKDFGGKSTNSHDSTKPTSQQASKQAHSGTGTAVSYLPSLDPRRQGGASVVVDKTGGRPRNEVEVLLLHSHSVALAHPSRDHSMET
jgi:hypothetical protein